MAWSADRGCTSVRPDPPGTRQAPRDRDQATEGRIRTCVGRANGFTAQVSFNHSDIPPGRGEMVAGTTKAGGPCRPSRYSLTPVPRSRGDPARPSAGRPAAAAPRAATQAFFKVWSILADALARDVERAPDLLRRARPSWSAKRISMTSRSRQRLPATATFSAAASPEAPLERRLGRLVLDRSPRARIPPRRRSANSREIGCWPHAQDVAHLARRCTRAPWRSPPGARGRAAARAGARRARPLLSFSTMWTGMRIALVGDRARHGLADPPGRVRGELVAAAVVELLDRADEPETKPSWIRSRKVRPQPAR